MTIVHLLPEDAIISLETAAKSLKIDPGDLLLLLWYRDFEIAIKLELKDHRTVVIGVDSPSFWQGSNKLLGPYQVRTLASVGVVEVYVEPGWYLGGEVFERERCSVTLSCLTVEAGDVARAVQEASTPVEQEQKNLSPRREATLLKLIGALLATQYNGPSYEKGAGAPNVSQMADAVLQDMASAGIDADVSKRTLQDLIPEAFKSITRTG